MQGYKHQAQYYETDQMGIIHHSNYIRWFESARIWYMNKIGVDFRDLEAQGVVSPVLEVSCTYKSMVRFEDNIVVVPKICKYNGVRMELSYEVFDDDTGELRSNGTSSHCFLDKNGKPVSLKKAYPVFDQAFRTAMETGIESEKNY
jgi:acyl-CoA thioester hydrolase